MTSIPVSSIAATLAVAFLSGCVERPSKIEPLYFSPMAYSGMTCEQLVAERNWVVQKVEYLSGKQRREANKDAVAAGVAVFFWPAALFLGDEDDRAPEIASLKGQYDALTHAHSSQGCDTSLLIES